MEPSEDDVPAAIVAYPIDGEAEIAHGRYQRVSRDVDEVAGEIEVEPAIAEHARLEARRVRDRNDEDPARLEHAHRLSQRADRRGYVLERVPEDDRGPLAGHLVDVVR